MRYVIILFILNLILFTPSSWAQGEADSFYRPYKKNELNYRLRPYIPDEDDRQEYLNSLRRQSCPEEINIGNVPENARIFGNVDIEITIDKDFYIDCSRF